MMIKQHLPNRIGLHGESVVQIIMIKSVEVPHSLKKGKQDPACTRKKTLVLRGKIKAQLAPPRSIGFQANICSQASFSFARTV